MELFKIQTQGPVAETASLYVRVNRGRYQAETGAMTSDTILSLDTYFNLFSISKYQKYTTITSARAELDVVGPMKIELFLSIHGQRDRCIAESQIPAGNCAPVSMPFDFISGYSSADVFLRFTAMGPGCFFNGGRYIADEATPRCVRVATVICTYHREEYLSRNVREISARLLQNEACVVSDALEIFIVDNGQSLAGHLPNYEKIRLFPNRNLGGSGGFTRGMIEAIRRKEEFTHILVMDDDIVIDPNVLEKTIQFLRFVKPEFESISIAGGMLCLDAPTIQHEAAACWNGGIRPLHIGLDMVERGSLLKNEKEHRADYGAWWYLCFPICFVSPENLPLPLFIKGDDIEYGLRNLDKILVLNGVGVWHESFVGKGRPYLDYYSMRNYLVVGSVSGIQIGRFAFLFALFKRMMFTVICNAPENRAFFSRAILDYLAGVDFFLSTDGERLNTELRNIPARDWDNTNTSKMRLAILLLGKVPTKDFWQALSEFHKLAGIYLTNRKKAEDNYRTRWCELTELRFWSVALCLDGEIYEQD